MIKMKLTDQLSNITQSNGGYNFNINGVLQWYANAYIMLFQYYANQFLFVREGNEAANIQEVVTNEYNACKALTNPSVVQSDFMTDYAYFVS
jgi:hypothetical protein